MTRPRLLLVPAFTELEWGIRAQLEEWADVATFDTPGVGDEPLPADFDPDPDRTSELLARWRVAAAETGLRAVDERGWDQFYVVTDDYGAATAVEIAKRRRESAQGLALGHASLSHSTEGERAPMNPAIWQAMAALARQGSEQLVRYGIAQATQGGISEEVAQEMTKRFPDMKLVSFTFDALAREPEPIGDDLARLDLLMLFAKHEGCLGCTPEGFEDAVAAFPQAETVICHETCSASPSFADALRGFCQRAA